MDEICVQSVTKSYGDKHVLEAVSLILPPGSRTCLMGPSGSGKTTFFRILMGLERADSGEILLRGRKRTSGDNELSVCRIGAVFQEDRLLEELSAVQNVRLTAAKTMSSAQIEQELLQILPREALHKSVKQQSGGMKRRVALARAVLAPSDVLLLDEPFTGLDLDTKQRTMAWLLRKQGGRTLLFSSHQEEDALLMNARVILFG